jgi:hypothetical protein
MRTLQWLMLAALGSVGQCTPLSNGATCGDGWYMAGDGQCIKCGSGGQTLEGIIALIVVSTVVLAALIVWFGARRQLVLLRAFGPDASEEDIGHALRPALAPALKRNALKWEDVLPLIK